MTDLSQPTSEQAPVKASGQGTALPVSAAETRQAASLREGKSPLAKSAKDDANDFPFAIALGEIYDGPLDLLLDLIRKQDINIGLLYGHYLIVGS